VEKKSKSKESNDLGCACYGNNQVHRCFCNDTKPLKLKKVEVKIHEIWQKISQRYIVVKRPIQEKKTNIKTPNNNY